MLLAVSYVLTLCSEGCLKCDSEDHCILSDASMAYVLKEHKAVMLNRPFCLYVDLAGNCLQCEDLFHVDPATGLCVDVHPKQTRVSCLLYSSESKCVECGDQTYLKDGACAPVKEVINGCVVYDTESTCKECHTNSVLSLDKKHCSNDSGMLNCSAASHVECVKCDKGHILDPNLYLEGFKQLDGRQAKTKALGLFSKLSESSLRLSAQRVCVPLENLHCTERESYSRICTRCSRGYYLSEDNKCRRNPYDIIPHCVVYSAAAACQTCDEGYYVRSNRCVQRQPAEDVEYCKRYDLSATSAICLECDEGHYLSDYACVERVRSLPGSIDHCKVYSVDSDDCQDCEMGYNMATDRLACKERAILGCAAYTEAAHDEEMHCKSCSDGHYMEHSNDARTKIRCILGKVDNCKRYADFEPLNCLECKNQYRLVDGSCVKSNAIHFCDTYHPLFNNNCERCSVNAVKIVYEKLCRPIVKPIDNCATYGNNDRHAPECEKCVAGFYLLDNRCVGIPIDHCVSYQDERCLKCQDNRYLSVGGECVDAPAYLKDSCSSYVGEGLQLTPQITEAGCLTCNEHMIPIETQDHYMCIEESSLGFYFDKPLIEGCIKYSNEGDCEQCDPRAESRFLRQSDSGTSCVSTCDTEDSPGSYSSFTLKWQDDASGAQLMQLNVCSHQAFNGCRAYAQNLHSIAAGQEICTACDEDDYLPVTMVLDFRYSIDIGEGIASDEHLVFYTHYLPSLTCQPLETEGEDGSASGLSAQVIPFCKYYMDHFNGRYPCIRCIDGYTGLVDDNGYIESCVINDEAVDYEYYNLNIVFHKLYSYHKCKDEDKIPFLYFDESSYPMLKIDPTAPLIFGKANLDDNGEVVRDGSPPKNFACLKNTPVLWTRSQHSFEDGNYGQCAMGVIVMIPEDDEGAYVYDTYCLSCMPGHFKSFNRVYSGTARSCVRIPNCKSGGRFIDGCETCEEGHMYPYYNEQVSFNVCAKVPEDSSFKFANCFAAHSENNVAVSCAVCNRGYYLTHNNVCAQIEVAHCSPGRFRARTLWSTENLRFGLYFNDFGIGCNQCEEGYQAVRHDSSSNLCVETQFPDIMKASMSPSLSAYIPNCRIYSAVDAEVVQCAKCEAGYVINGMLGTIHGNACYPEDDLLDCKVALQPGFCTECADESYSLIVGKCLSVEITNCKAYNYNYNRREPTCTACASGYYLSTVRNICIKGNRPGCDVYTDDNPNDCLKCLTGFSRDDGFYGVGLCLPFSPYMNCNDVHLSRAEDHLKFDCVACIAGSENMVTAKPPNEQKTTCYPIRDDPHCQTYDHTTYYTSTTFPCKLCKSGYYVDSEGRCAEHTIIIQCKDYEDDRDACRKCKEGHFLSEDGTKCEPNPSGIQYCAVYETATTCKLCGPFYYLSDNACVEVKDGIPQCLYYRDRDTCHECEPGFTLLQNRCVRMEARNCLQYASERECTSCRPQYALVVVDSIVHCEKVSIPHCEVVNDRDPSHCEECADQYYAMNGSCYFTELKIPHCLKYETSITCRKCEKHYALSADRRHCDDSQEVKPYIDPKCETSVISSTPICTMCRPGYYFIGKQCIGDCNEGSEESGCFACDPYSPDTCLVCKSLYHMYKEGKCKKTWYYEPRSIPDFSSSSAVGIAIARILLVLLWLVK